MRWPYVAADGTGGLQRAAIELKVWRDGRTDPVEQGRTQLDAYLERLGLDDGVLVLFNRRADAEPIAARTRFEATATPGGRAVTVLRA